MSPPALHSIAIVGAGRLGGSLAALLSQRGLESTVVGRGEAIPSASVVVLAVPDRSLASLVRELPTGSIALHCSGVCPVDVLSPHHPRGSWHPLMTFPGVDVSLPDVRGAPVAVDGDDLAREAALALSQALEMRPFLVPGDRRLYHASAVMAGNLVTVLLAEAGRVLEAAGVHSDEARGILYPLAQASLANAVDDPARSLTGPVAREDWGTLQAHREALADAGLDDVIAWVNLLERAGRRLREQEE